MRYIGRRLRAEKGRNEPIYYNLKKDFKNAYQLFGNPNGHFTKL